MVYQKRLYRNAYVPQHRQGDPPAMACLQHALSAGGVWLKPPRYPLLKMSSFFQKIREFVV